MSKLQFYVRVAHFINIAFHNRIHQFVYMVSLSAVVAVALLPVTKSFIDFWLFLSVISFFLSVTTVRLSHNSIYSPVTKHLSMNIKNVGDYHKWHYINEKKTVAQKYQEEFIEALEKAHKKGYKTIKMSTHEWVLNQVLLNERVSNLYDVSYKESGTTKITLEVLTLASNEVFERDSEQIWKQAKKSRKHVKIRLKRKK